MTALALIIAVVAVIGWLATLGVTLYAVVTESAYVDDASFTLLLVTIIAPCAVAGAAALLGYEWG